MCVYRQPEIMKTRNVSIDIETFSDMDIKKTGSYKYAMSPKFEILLIAYAINEGPVECIDLADPKEKDMALLPEFIDLLYADDTILHAYNAAFEHWCFNVWLKRMGKDDVPISKWRCTMVHGLYCGYTAGLGVTGEVLGLPQDKQKMKVGTALIRKFCVPAKPTKDNPNRDRIYPKDEPEQWELFKQYCRNDVEAEREIERRLSFWPLPDYEQKQWEMNVELNIDGIGIDTDLVRGAQEINRIDREELIEEAKMITGLENPNSVAQLKEWLNAELEDEQIESLRKADVSGLLESGLSSDAAERMLVIRQQLGMSSVKKYKAFEDYVCDDGRARGILFFYGANRSGRWAGRGIQPQNLTKPHVETLDIARSIVSDGDIDTLRMVYGDNVQDILSQIIRTVIVPTRGCAYAIADYSAIEARLVSYISNEQWVLDSFLAGKDIYCATASQMFNVPVEKHGQNAHLRQKGKIAQLACGYGGGSGAMLAMGALDMGLKEEDLPEIVDAWRAANPHIVKLWETFDLAAKRCINLGEPQYLDHGITFRMEYNVRCDNRAFTIQLPSGRKLFYIDPSVRPAKRFPRRKDIMYKGVKDHKWVDVDSRGSKLVENVTQAIARDVLADALTRIKESGVGKCVMHVHDEVIVEVPEAEKEERLNAILEIMSTPPEWAPGLPLKGAGFCSEFYTKD